MGEGNAERGGRRSDIVFPSSRARPLTAAVPLCPQQKQRLATVPREGSRTAGGWAAGSAVWWKAKVRVGVEPTKTTDRGQWHAQPPLPP